MDQRKIIINEIKNAQSNLGELRIQEKAIRESERIISSLPAISGEDLRSQLAKILPSHLLPSNIGKYDQISWPYWYELEFDFSVNADTVFNVNQEIEKFFQVGQEAGFLLTHIFRAYNSSTGAGLGAPLVLDMRDLQSSRNFNDEPIQIQHVGTKGQPMKLDTPIMLYPNSKLQVSLRSWVSAQVTVPNTSGVQRLVFMGRRVKMKEILNMKADLYSDQL